MRYFVSKYILQSSKWNFAGDKSLIIQCTKQYTNTFICPIFTHTLKHTLHMHIRMHTTHAHGHIYIYNYVMCRFRARASVCKQHIHGGRVYNYAQRHTQTYTWPGLAFVSDLWLAVTSYSREVFIATIISALFHKYVTILKHFPHCWSFE